MSSMWSGGFFAMIAFVVAPMHSALGETPAGMVLQVSGKTEPAVAAYSELPVGEAVRMAGKTQLTVVHYRSCNVVTIAGGTVWLTADGVEMDGGTLENRMKRPCPREHRLGGDGKASGAAVLSRAARLSRVPVHPRLVLAGAQADRVRAAEIRGDAELHRLVLHGRELGWAAGDALLAAGKKYVLLLSLEGDGAPLELPFTAVEVEGGGESATFDIVRLD